MNEVKRADIDEKKIINSLNFEIENSRLKNEI